MNGGRWKGSIKKPVHARILVLAKPRTDARGKVVVPLGISKTEDDNVFMWLSPEQARKLALALLYQLECVFDFRESAND